MTNSEKLFLLLAEEKNFRRTAEKAFITQQCLSDHIKRLEEHYATELLTRRPSVALTEAGEALQRTLLQMQGLERGLKNELAEIAGGERGRLRIGANHTRAQFFVAEFFKRYHTRFPRVEIEVYSEDTAALAEHLLRGEIDLFLGVNAEIRPPLKSRPISQEQLCLLLSPAYLRRYLGPKAAHYLEADPIVALEDFNDLPFVMNHSSSTLAAFVQQYIVQSNLHFDVRLGITDYLVAAQLCRSGEVAGFCPEMLRSSILNENKNFSADEQLLVIPLPQMGKPLCVELIYNELVHYPRYIRECFDEIEAVFQAKDGLRR